MNETGENDAFIPEYLSSLEENVLSELSTREKNYSFRFNGLRRILRDVHQQKLTRALERLQEDNLIERHPDGGYTLENFDLLVDGSVNWKIVHTEVLSPGSTRLIYMFEVVR